MTFRLPIVLDVTDRRCLVIGGGPIAAHRAELLLAAGAHVVVTTDAPGAEVEAIVHAGKAGLLRRLATPGDLDGAAVAIATLEDDADIEALWQRADATGVLFSASDSIDHCHFALPAIISRGDLQVAISTSGKAPALAKRLRNLFEETIGDDLGRLVDVVADARAQLVPRTIPFGEWSARWSRALEPLDELVARIAAGDDDGVFQKVVSAVRGGGETDGSEPSTSVAVTGSEAQAAAVTAEQAP